MKRDWRKYHNEQGYADCQLIALVNAYYYLTGKWIDRKSKRYKKMLNSVGAIAGPAINIKKAHKALGIEIIWEGYSFLGAKDKDGNKIKDPLPYIAKVWHPKYGYHSVLVIGINTNVGAVRVANFREETTTEGWIFEEDFRVFVHAAKGNYDPVYRILRLRRTK